MSFNKRPLIAVTGPNKRLRIGWWATRFVLWLVGARACYVTTATAQLSQPVDGVIIGGGDDIEPQHYGEDGDAGATYDPARDQLEIAVIKQALTAEVPILGICRGAQLINVVQGGSLYQDIRPLRERTPNRNSAFFVKWAHIEPDSQLHTIVQREQIPINSLHSQAVNRLGDGLVVAARDSDSFVQAFESQQHCLLGVQWHPEYLPHHRRQRDLFHWFVTRVCDQSKQLQLTRLPTP